MTRIIQILTGARDKEQPKTIMCFLALFMLMLSYYLIKPARQSVFMAEFDADKMPIMYLLIPALSFSVARTFNFYYERIDRYKLIFRTYILIMTSKVFFDVVLPHWGKYGAILFFFWGSVYFLLALPTLWACINDIFNPEQGERCFGFVAMGATCGGIVGSAILSLISRQSGSLKDHALVLSAGAMGVSLALILTAARVEMRRRAVEGDDGQRVVKKKKPKPAPTKSSGGLFGDVKDLWAIPYVRAIAVMVFCLALYNSTTQFLSQIMIEQRIGQQQFQESYPALNDQLNAQQNLPAGAPNVKGALLVRRLKSTKEEGRKKVVEEFLASEQLPTDQADSVVGNYKSYQKDYKDKVNTFLADISFYQGIVGIFMLAGASRYLFRNLGLRVAACLLPSFALASTLAMGTPIGLGVVALILTIGGGLNYSLNNATKELLYTMTTQETKFKYKPLIDGLGQRLGGQSAAILVLILVNNLGLRSLAGYSESTGIWMVIGVVVPGVAYWLKNVYFVGGEYDRMRREQREEDLEAAEPLAPVNEPSEPKNDSGAIIE
jgi:ATP/ADP translocase